MPKRRVEKNENIDVGNFDYLKEAAYTSMLSDVKSIPMYNFINAMKSSGSNEFYFGNTYERMMDDSIISSVIDLYVEDATQIDPQTKRMVWIDVDKSDDAVEDKVSKGLSLELNRFLDEIEIQKWLPQIARRVLVHGDAPTKLSFVDKLEDDRLKVHKLNESDLSQVIQNKIVDSNEVIQSSIDLSNKPVLLESYINSFQDKSRILNRYNKKVLNESVLKEDNIIDYKSVFNGRWYIEQIGMNCNLCALESKGKVIALLDRENSYNIITKDNIALFMNPKATRVTVEVGDQFKSADRKEYYTISKGDSFLKNARIAYQVLSSLEDILLLTRMTRSILYRIFSVEVGQKGNKETASILNSLKNKIKMDETVDVRSKIYNSSISQVPLGDSIFIPTRNGIGAINVQTVGGDFNLRDAIDLDYFKDKLFAALKVPRSFIGFEDDMPGSLGNTSLVRQDIRYARSVRSLQNVLCEGVKDLINIYLKYTRTEKVLNELPTITVCMTSINTAEDLERVETEKTRMETVDKIVETLENLSVDMESHRSVRDEIIQQWFGKDILDKIKADEEENKPVENKEHKFHSTQSSPDIPLDVSDEPVDLDNEMNDDTEMNDNTEVEEPVENDTSDESNKEPQDIPYSLK